MDWVAPVDLLLVGVDGWFVDERLEVDSTVELKMVGWVVRLLDGWRQSMGY